MTDNIQLGNCVTTSYNWRRHLLLAGKK